MPLQATSGAASYDGFGGGVAAVPNYIEDVFSTYLYTGTGANQTITNSIDLSTKGGMVWIKDRKNVQYNHLFDTSRGTNTAIFSNDTFGNTTVANSLTAFNTTGFNLGTSANVNGTIASYVNAPEYASWTFRKQPKFFDVVTYTGTGSTQNISHNLGSVPGCIIIKRTNTSGSSWIVYHQSLTATSILQLNTTDAYATATNWWNDTTPTSTVFTVGSNVWVNQSGSTYVAYLFAHNAGGFGLTGTDNVISCGSVSVTNGSYADVNLGYEPQFVMLKASSTTGAWFMNDTMRGMPARPSLAASLSANSSAAEVAGDGPCFASSTGFTVNNNNVTGTYIYIAIRRGPMKVPTSGTSVFSPVAFTGTNTTTVINAGFPMDMVWIQARNTNAVLGGGAYDLDRLRGNVNRLFIPSTGAESASLGSPYDTFDNMTGLGADGTFFNNSAINYSDWFFRRAPSFFDEVCYTGNGASDRAINHNLGVVPELIITKSRSDTITWLIYSATGGQDKYLQLGASGTAAFATLSGIWGTTAFTSSDFRLGPYNPNASGRNFVAYLFATCAGVSKVGSYTGTATTKQVDCGFTGGARFVLIKRTDSTGDWYVWDSARGIVAGNDPYLLLNSTAAEVTSTDYIDTYSAGFEISSTAPAAINASGGTYIFLAIA